MVGENRVSIGLGQRFSLSSSGVFRMKAFQRWLIPCAVAAAMVPGGFAVAQAVSGNDGGQTSDRPSAVSGNQVASDEVPRDGLIPWSSDQPWDGDPSKLLLGYTSLSDCPEALEFLQQPEVENFYDENFGRALGPQDSFQGGCPEVASLKRGYEAARERVSRGNAK